MKIFCIIKHHKGRENEVRGTILELREYFSYTLECGHSWNSKIPLEPKTIKSLVKALNDSKEETQGSCFEQDYFEIGA
jgi:hypothetical protein